MKKFHVLGVLVLGGLLMGMAPKPLSSMMPVFTLENVEGQPISSEAFRGKIVLVNFWASWCPPCVAEIPTLKKLYEQYRAKGVEIIGIAMDDDGAESVKPFAEKKQINYPLLIGSDEVADSFGGIRGLPTAFLVDRQGRIVRKFIGEQRRSTLESAIEKLL